MSTDDEDGDEIQNKKVVTRHQRGDGKFLNNSREEKEEEQETAIVPYRFDQAFPLLFRLLVLPYFYERKQQQQKRSTPVHPPPTTNDLLRDLLPTILSYADAETLSSCGQVCCEWRNLAKNENHWENLCRVSFGISATQFKNPKPHPKELYIKVHQQWKQLYQNATSRDPLRGTNLRNSLPTISVASMQ